MKKIYNVTITALLAVAILFSSCEQENYEPNLTVAPGGGTVTTYKAYTLSSTTADDIYGRIVFYKYSDKVTLVQMGLYNTTDGENYTAAIFSGDVLAGSPDALVTLDNVSGATGAFTANKFFVIDEVGFYDGLSAYDANVRVMLSSASVSEGDIGSNADPVAEN